jgi:hypothetical protein
MSQILYYYIVIGIFASMTVAAAQDERNWGDIIGIGLFWPIMFPLFLFIKISG